MITASSFTHVNDIYNEMSRSNLMLIYSGDFSQSVTKRVLSMTEQNFDDQGVDSYVKRKVYNIMMEALQNISKHQTELENEEGSKPAIFTIGRDENGDFAIITGNLIAQENIENVKSRIDQVNGLDAAGLKALYKEARLNSRLSEVGGAGLGFIDMARKSERNLEYNFEKITDQLYYFMLMVKIDATEE